MKPSLFNPLWLVLAVLALSWCWLLPNQTQPWLAFHRDAWAAIVLTLVSGYVLLKSPHPIAWNGLTVLTVAMLAVITMQYAVGHIHSLGVAWINAAYLLGFLLTLLAGSAWERISRFQCADLVFIAVLIASLASVALQIHQWLGFESIGPWILKPNNSRQYANMAQPNQLASLLLLGVLACAWLNHRGWLQRYAAVLFAMFLLFGVALTQSRTGWVNTALIVSALIAWRNLPHVGRLPLVAMGLMGFYAVCVLSLPVLHELFAVSGVPTEVRSIGDSARLKLWIALIEAVTMQPWFGFGWGQVGHAQFLVGLHQMMDGATLQNAHNLPLDLVLWMGVPLGLVVTTLLGRWVWQAVTHVSNIYQILMLMFLMVLGVHAMLEYPLQYAYFLLPAGLMLGALNSSLGFPILFHSPKWTGPIVVLIAATMLAVTIRDYMRVETSFYGLRFEERKIQTNIPATPPDVLVLTQWFDFITLARIDPAKTHGTKDIENATSLVKTLPSPLGFYKLAAMLAFADRPTEAQHWLQVLCKVNNPKICTIMQNRWIQESPNNPPMGAVQWVK